jgi:glycosyltransferase involved in cell wall biosynthesis
MSSELVSIVIAAYNAEKYISEAIESCTQQTYKNIEIIIVNDGSKDQTPAIVEEYAKKDARIRIIHQENKGEGATRNVGNAVAKGNFIAVMDADDVMLPERIEEQMKYFEQYPELDLLGSWMQYISEKGKQTGVYIFPDDMKNPAQFEVNYVKGNRPILLGHPSVMYRKEKVFALGGYRNIRPGADIDLWNRMKETGCKISVIPKVLVKYRVYIGAGNTSTKLESYYTFYWLELNSNRRRENLPEIPKEEYMESLKEKPFWERISFKRHIYALYFSRKFSVAWGEGQYLNGIYFLLMAGLSDPMNMLDKLKRRLKFRMETTKH